MKFWDCLEIAFVVHIVGVAILCRSARVSVLLAGAKGKVISQPLYYYLLGHASQHHINIVGIVRMW